jgi:hypothetical protein
VVARIAAFHSVSDAIEAGFEHDGAAVGAGMGLITLGN